MAYGYTASRNVSEFEGATMTTTFVSPVRMSTHQRQCVHMACSLLLDYPSTSFVETLSAVEGSLASLPTPITTQLSTFCSHVRISGIRSLAEHYVSTFDQRRRCSLYLSYYAVGDTRQRGTAIVAFQDALHSLGFELVRKELPDHLCVVLEASARADAAAHEAAVTMLAAHRDGIEVLRTALLGLDSPYAHVVSALCMSLPEIDAETKAYYHDLIHQGPPAELVGIGTPLPFPTSASSRT